MSRARWTTRALVTTLATASLAVPLLCATAAAAPVTTRSHLVAASNDPGTTPLLVTLTSLAPSQILTTGAIRLTGVVTNTSDEGWTDINVAPFASREPITTRSDLALAAASSPSVAVGERITDSGTYAAVGDLSPGESARFRLRTPVTSLGISGGPGVYWIGVHALGANADGRDLVADGRARTFIPLVTKAQARRRSVPVSVVLPLRERARRAADGSLNGPTRWANLTGSDGRLTRLVDFGSSAGSRPLSWLVDPAVLDALDDYSRGNPPWSLDSARSTGNSGDSGDSGGSGGSSDDTKPSEKASPSASPAPEPGTPTTKERSGARSVLEAFLGTARAPVRTLLTLGYADPDVASLARRRASLIKRADTLAAGRMKVWGLTGTPAVAPPTGYFDPDLLPKIDQDSLMVLSDASRLQDPPLSRLPSGQELVLSDARAIAGGPAPTKARNPLALRQRILSEAALEVTNGEEPTRPIVVTLPARWDPGVNWRRADFFGGLETPWVRLSALPRGATSTYAGRLPYGRGQLAREIGDLNVAATRTLVRTSAVLGNLLATRNDVTDRLAGAALQASAYSAFRTQKLAAAKVLALDATIRGEMGRVQVIGSNFVTLSGGSGSLTVSLVNGLKEPVTVGLKAHTDGPEVKVETPEPVNMQPGQRTTLRLQVSSGVGVHEVTISPITTKGESAGSPLTFSLRTSQVGRLIWYIIFAGAALLAVMVVRRIVLRVRSHRWRQGDAA